MLDDLRSSLERYNGKISKEMFQHYEIVKIECILHLLRKIEISIQTKYLTKRLEEKLEVKVLFTLTVAKINNGTTFKDGNSMKKKVFTPRKKGKNIGVHAETIKGQ